MSGKQTHLHCNFSSTYHSLHHPFFQHLKLPYDLHVLYVHNFSGIFPLQKYYICMSFIRHQAPKCKYYIVVSQPFLVLSNHHLKHNFNSENNLETSMPICLCLQEDIMNHKLCGLSNHRALSAPRWAWKALSLFFFFSNLAPSPVELIQPQTCLWSQLEHHAWVSSREHRKARKETDMLFSTKETVPLPCFYTHLGFPQTSRACRWSRRRSWS